MLKQLAEQLARQQVVVRRGMLNHRREGNRKWHEVSAEMEAELLPQLTQLEDRFIRMTETYAKIVLRLSNVSERKRKREPIDLADLRRRMMLDDELMVKEKNDARQTG